MTRRHSRILQGLIAAALFALPTLAQQQNTRPAGVWRITYYSVKPGMMPDVMNDLRENYKPVAEFQKTKGWIKDYKIFTNPTKNGPGDWDYAMAVQSANWAALDPDAERGKEGRAFLEKHYGSKEATDAAPAKRRERQTTIRSVLMTELQLQ